MSMSQDEVSSRIEAVLAKKSGAVGPDRVETGTEGRITVGGRNPDGTQVANVNLTRSREQMLAERDTLTKHGPHSSTIHMRDSSMEPTVATSVLVGDLLVFMADTGAGYVDGAQRISTQDPDGKVTQDAVAVTKLMYAALKAGHQPSLPSKGQ